MAQNVMILLFGEKGNKNKKMKFWKEEKELKNKISLKR